MNKRKLFACTWLSLTVCILINMQKTSWAYVNFHHEITKAYYPVYPEPIIMPDSNIEQIKRGEYLAQMGDCISCHTPDMPNPKPFSGNRALVVQPFGTFYGPNITPDKETGIGDWTDQQFVRAMHDGIGIHGENLFPVFPYVYFNRVTREDLLAIKAYLMSLPPVKSKNKKNDILFPFSIRLLQYGWKFLFFYPDEDPAQNDPSQSPIWNRGKYIVDGLAHCSMCHTPVNIFGAPEKSKYLSGAFVDGFWAPNITSAALEGYSDEDIMDVFRNEMLLGGQGQVLGPMSEANHNSLKYMTDDDLRAIAVYLKTVKGVKPRAAGTADISPKTVRDIYQISCASCHKGGIYAAPIIGDQANWELRLKNKGMAGLIKHAINGFNQMPPKGTCKACTNAQIRAVVEYMVAKSLPSAGKAPSLVIPTSSTLKKLTLQQGEQIYLQNCASCHADGKNNAPKLGDKDAWKALFAKGMPALLNYAIYGKDGKHVRGNCTACTNQEVKIAVKYMAQQSSTDGDYTLW